LKEPKKKALAKRIKNRPQMTGTGETPNKNYPFRKVPQILKVAQY
jgi:hypothetical protein